MTRKALAIKASRAPKFSTRLHRRCALCGRPRGYIRLFKMCRLCFRHHASKGALPGVKKISW
jgi:small subunit ribosomal protein S14